MQTPVLTVPLSPMSPVQDLPSNAHCQPMLAQTLTVQPAISDLGAPTLMGTLLSCPQQEHELTGPFPTVASVDICTPVHTALF